MSDRGGQPGEEAEVPWPVVAALVELTERALAEGLDTAASAAIDRLVAAGFDPGGPVAQPALAAAVASAARALAARESGAVEVDELRELARRDDVTGALNRRAFFVRLEEELARADRARTAVTLVLFDLDGFKAINDEHGHPAGDLALRAFAEGLGAKLRASDSLGRVGGDEFALILVGIDAVHEVTILRRLASTMASAGPGTTEVRTSLGAARYPEDGTSREELVEVADRRLYEHKRRAADPT
jgi:diguanylate cyclase (GGDEF)-like protein